MSTKQTEALKLALEALEYIDRQDNDRDFLSPEECCDLDDAITAIREALAERCVCGEPDTPGTHRTDGPCLAEKPAQQQEPVAWRWENGGEDKWLNKYIYLDNGGPDCPEDCEPLYTSPPASKPWVPLTEFDIDQIPYSCSHADSRLIAFAIEAKLREKNA